MAAADEAVEPLAVGVDVRLRIAGRVRERPGGGRGERGGLGEDAPHPLVGGEGLPVHDADGGALAGAFGVQRGGRFLLDEGVDLVVERVVVGVDGVEVPVADLEVGHLGWVVGLRQRVDAGPGDVVDAAEGAHDQPVREGRGAQDGVAVGLRAVVARREQHVPATGTPVGSGEAEVADVAEPEVVDDAQGVRRVLHDEGPVVEVEEHRRRRASRCSAVRKKAPELARGVTTPRVALPSRPTLRKPWRMATNEAPGRALRYTSNARFRSSMS